MNNYENRSIENQLAEFETPFSDVPQVDQKSEAFEPHNFYSELGEVESPFRSSFEIPDNNAAAVTPAEEMYAELLGELNDPEFETALYELANEAEEKYSDKISNETAMGEGYIPFVSREINEYLEPLAAEAEETIDKISGVFSGNDLADHNDAQIEKLFEQFEFSHRSLSPVQEDFLGKLIKKAKKVVKKGISFAKKAVGKILPIKTILNKLKKLVRPLLQRVLKFAINKLPKKFRPFAQTLAKKFLKREVSESENYEESFNPAAGDLEAVQHEFDNYIANLVFTDDESEVENLVQNYVYATDEFEREFEYETDGMRIEPIETARQKFINDLKDLKEGESPQPAIENFLPAVIMAAKPLIKMGIKIIGRKRVINFLAGILTRLVAKFIPKSVARPLSTKIVDMGMSAIGFEIYEGESPELAYEAIANTIENTVNNMGSLDESYLEDEEQLTSIVLEAFDEAASNNFPSSYIKEEARKVSKSGSWVLKPRKGPRHYYKKFTHVFSVSLTPAMVKNIKSFNGVPLASFLKDKLGIDGSKPVQAKVHLYEAISGTWLSRISKWESVPGLGTSKSSGWKQIHPLTVNAASHLLKEPGLGKDVSSRFMQTRHKINIGQRFYYLEISGAKVKKPYIPPTDGKPDKPKTITPRSSDIQGVINFVRSEIRLNYFFSEEEAKSVVEKLNRNDHLGAALTIRHSVRNVLNDLLIKNVSKKVKIIHEAVPELYLENVHEEDLIPAGVAAAAGAFAAKAAKDLLVKLIEKLIVKISQLAYQAVVNYFKARAAEFKQMQAEPADGVTVKIIWVNIPGMSQLRAIINAVRGQMSVGNLADLVLPSIPTPEVQVKAGKKFD